jgi:hypothetical protein
MIYILCTITACLLSVYLGWCLKTTQVRHIFESYFKDNVNFFMTRENYKQILGIK